jgi:hypothetical protein
MLMSFRPESSRMEPLPPLRVVDTWFQPRSPTTTVLLAVNALERTSPEKGKLK